MSIRCCLSLSSSSHLIRDVFCVQEDEEQRPPKKKKKRKVRQQKSGGSHDKGGDRSPLDWGDIDPDEPTYCLCEQVSYGEMIGCDNDSCPIEWFHFNCVQLVHKPKGKWFCPKCRGDKASIRRPDLKWRKHAWRHVMWRTDSTNTSAHRHIPLCLLCSSISELFLKSLNSEKCLEAALRGEEWLALL